MGWGGGGGGWISSPQMQLELSPQNAITSLHFGVAIREAARTRWQHAQGQPPDQGLGNKMATTTTSRKQDQESQAGRGLLCQWHGCCCLLWTNLNQPIYIPSSDRTTCFCCFRTALNTRPVISVHSAPFTLALHTRFPSLETHSHNNMSPRSSRSSSSSPIYSLSRTLCALFHSLSMFRTL